MTSDRERHDPSDADTVDADTDDGSATWRVFVTLVTATALFFACFAALYDASVWWGPRQPTLGPPAASAQ